MYTLLGANGNYVNLSSDIVAVVSWHWSSSHTMCKEACMREEMLTTLLECIGTWRRRLTSRRTDEPVFVLNTWLPRIWPHACIDFPKKWLSDNSSTNKVIEVGLMVASWWKVWCIFCRYLQHSKEVTSIGITGDTFIIISESPASLGLQLRMWRLSVICFPSPGRTLWSPLATELTQWSHPFYHYAWK